MLSTRQAARLNRFPNSLCSKSDCLELCYAATTIGCRFDRSKAGVKQVAASSCCRYFTPQSHVHLLLLVNVTQTRSLSIGATDAFPLNRCWEAGFGRGAV